MDEDEYSLTPVTFLTLLAVMPLSLPCFDSIAASFINLEASKYAYESGLYIEMIAHVCMKRT